VPELGQQLERTRAFTVLAALAAVTEHLGLAGTINSTFNEPYEVARQFASLDPSPTRRQVRSRTPTSTSTSPADSTCRAARRGGR
jgi:hypothetical protein